jgi:hypothetical protein
MKTILALLVSLTMSVNLFAAAYSPTLSSPTVAAGNYDKLPTFLSGTTLPNVVSSNAAAACTNLAWNVRPNQDCGLWLYVASTNALTNGTFVLHFKNSPDLASTPSAVKILPYHTDYVATFTLATNSWVSNAWLYVNLGASNYASSRSVQVTAFSNVTAIALTGSKLIPARAY